MIESEGRANIVAIARTWLKTPYHPEGRVKGVGTDCGMLIAEVYEEAGFIPHMAVEHYAPDEHLHFPDEKYIAYVMQHARQVEAPKPGDVALWRFGKRYSHGAIVTDWPLVIHATVHEGMVWECDVSEFGLYARRKPLFFSFWG